MAKVTAQMVNEAMLEVGKQMQPRMAAQIQRDYEGMSASQRMQMNSMSRLLADELNKRLAS